MSYAFKTAPGTFNEETLQELLDLIDTPSPQHEAIVARTTYKVGDLTNEYNGNGLFAAMAKADGTGRVEVPWQMANLVSSRTPAGKHMPIIDLDYPHHYEPSTNKGHGHLYLNVEIPTWRWVVLMVGLYVGGVIEKGYFWWSLRRRANFVRLPWIKKEET